MAIRKERLDAHKKLVSDREKEAAAIKADYRKIKDSPALLDLIKKMDLFMQYHMSVARDGVANRMRDDLSMETIDLPHEKRVSESDRAAGIKEIRDYVERQIADPKVTPTKAKEEQS